MGRDSNLVTDFASYIAEHTQDFTGREWIFAQFDRWLKSVDSPQFFIITGEPGIGKTAIAARLTQIRDLAAFHFCISRRAETIVPVNFVRSISQQLTGVDAFARRILEDNEINLKAELHIQQLYGEAIAVNIENLVVNASSASRAFTRTVSDPLKALYAERFEQQVVILVDALDESIQQSGENIVELLANERGLPSQVRFVLTSRPDNAALRHFEELRVPYLELDAGRDENSNDIREFVGHQLSSSTGLEAQLAEQGVRHETFIDRVLVASQGNFLYLVYLIPAVANGTQRVDALEALPRGLDGIYRQFLRTRTLGQDVRGRWRAFYRPVLGVLAAAQAPLSIQQVVNFTGMSEQDVYDCLLDVRQFLDPTLVRSKRYQLYHQSVADFLWDEERAREFWIDPTSVHQQIVAYYEKQYADRWADCDVYGLRHLPAHLVSAGRMDLLGSLLTNFGWLQAKLSATDIGTLIADYDLHPQDAALDSVRGALRLSPHVLTRDQTQLAAQLLGRLMTKEEVPAIGRLLEGARRWKGAPWLRPLTPSLPQAGEALLRILPGHSSMVYAVSPMPNGQVISASADHTLKVWDLESGTVLRTLTGHSAEVRGVAVTSDGKRAVSASRDRTLKVWDLETDTVLRTLTGHTDNINAVAVTSDGRYAVSAAGSGGYPERRGTLKVWDLESGTELHTLYGHSENVWDVAVTPGGRYAVSASWDFTLKVWNLETGREVHTLRGHSSPVNAVAVTSDGRYAVSAAGSGLGDKGSNLKVWDIESGTDLRTLEGHFGRVVGVAVTSDGRQAVSTSWDETLRVWDLKTGAELGNLNGSIEPGRAVMITAEDQRVVTGSTRDNTVKVWDLERKAQSTIRQVGGVSLDSIDAVAVTPDGRHALSASSDQTLNIWDLENGQELNTLPFISSDKDIVSPRSLTVTPDGRRAIAGGIWGTLTVWDLLREEQVFQLRNHTGQVRAVAVTPDSRKAVSASEDHTLKVWDLESGVELHTLQGHADGVFAVALTPDGRGAVSGAADGAMMEWDIDNGAPLFTFGRVIHFGTEVIAPDQHDETIWEVALTSDGRTVSASEDWDLKVWNTETGELTLTLQGHAEGVIAVKLIQGGQRAVSLSWDGTLKVWDLQTGAILHSMGKRVVSRQSVEVTPDGKRAVSASGNTLIVWDLDDGSSVANFIGESELTDYAIAPDGATVVAGDDKGRVHILRLEGVDSTTDGF